MSTARRILIVDDRTELRQLVRMTLEGGRYELYEAASGREAIECTRSLRPHLVILDVMMPGEIDGLAACTAIKSDPDLDGVRVVLLTARGQQRDLERGLAAGADAYVVKPFSPAELLDRVEELLA